MSVTVDEVLPQEPTGEVVHWMEPHPTRLGPRGLSAVAVGAFAFGIATTLGALALYRWFVPRREGLPPWRWGRGPLH